MAENVAIASTSVPPAVASEAIVLVPAIEPQHNPRVQAASDTTAGRARGCSSLRRRLADRGERLRLALDLLIVAWLIWLFDAINNLAPVRQRLAEHNGRQLLDLERSLHLDPEHALNRWLAARPTLSELVVLWYENVHIVVTLAAFAWLWWRRSELLGVMRATLVLVNLIALAVFWSFPTAPPRMLSGDYVDLVARTQHLPVWQFGATALDSNQLCAFPSLHIAWATWSSIAVWHLTSRRWLRAVAVVYPFVTTFAVMATANHYLVDALVGGGLTLLAFAALNRGRLPRALALGAR